MRHDPAAMRLLAPPLALIFAAATASGQATGSAPGSASAAVVEIRSYTLKPGERERFHRRFVDEALPLLRRSKIDVVAYGPSLGDNDSYFLMRAFASQEERERQEAAFYASPEWVNGPRAAVLAAIDHYNTVVIRTDRTALEGLRRTMMTDTPSTASDLDMLVRLNDDYITAVKASDVARFEQILAPDFLCSLPDGSLLDRAQFLAHAAQPYALRDLQAHDVTVRILGDTAIVHARTTFTLANGTPGSGRYTDVWARRDGHWVAVAAHVTRN